MTHLKSVDPQTSRAACAPMTALQPPAESASHNAALADPGSFKVEVRTMGTISFIADDVRLATQPEAEAYGRHLKETSTEVWQWRVRPSSLPVNAVFANGRLTFRSSGGEPRNP